MMIDMLVRTRDSYIGGAVGSVLAGSNFLHLTPGADNHSFGPMSAGPQTWRTRTRSSVGQDHRVVSESRFRSQVPCYHCFRLGFHTLNTRMPRRKPAKTVFRHAKIKATQDGELNAKMEVAMENTAAELLL